MIVVHAFWSVHGLRVWAESSAKRPSARARTPAEGAARPRLHPFAADARALREAAGALGQVHRHVFAPTATLLLPSHARAPQASPQLVEAFPDLHPTDQPASNGLWTVPVLAFERQDAVNFLLSLGEPPQGVTVGDTLRALAEAAQMALDLVARGRVMPVLERSGDAWIAAWRPVFTAQEDADHAAALRRALPAACAAAAEEPRLPVPDVADMALAALVDALARGPLTRKAVLPARRGRRTPGEAWVVELLPTGGAGFRDSGADEVQRGLHTWTRALTRPTAGLRTCFRLSPPGDAEELDESIAPITVEESGDPAADAIVAAEGGWRLEVLLQAVDDPSLLVPAAQVWRTQGPLTVFRRVLDDPQEQLLGDLGRALRLVPDLAPVLRSPRPSGMEMDAEGAYRFLREAVPALSQAGFGVLVPGWWTRPAARLGVKLKATPSAGSAGERRVGMDTLCAYDWQVSLGGETLSADEFRALAAMKVPLVRVRGAWVELKPGEVEAALRMFDRGRGGTMTAAEVLRLAMGADAPDELPLESVEAEGWLGELLSADGDAKVEDVAEPAGFVGELRPYQRRGLSWMSFLDGLGLGACLADDMGLGKTVQLLALLLAERGDPDAATAPTLLVCPMSLLANWHREAARFAPGLRVHVHHGAGRSDADALQATALASDLVLTTYALAARDQEALAAVGWGRVVLDEAQNVKNSAARQAQAVRTFRAPRRIALTGTPVENRLAELWSILDFLNPGLLGNAADFRRRFATPIEKHRDTDRAAQLQRLTRPFVLRRLKTDQSIIRDLPAKHEMKVFCTLTREQASLYQATVDEMMQRVEQSEGIERRGLVLATLLRLKQVCNHPAHLLGDRSALAGRSGKLERLEEIVAEVLALGDRALVFTQFAEMGKLLRQRLEERFAREVPFLHGGTTRAARDSMVARFQAGDGPPVLLLSLKAGGTGLNLTAANHVIHFDRWWNPAVEDQATDRAFRIGQRRDVQVRKLVCAGTLEERIDEMIEDKKKLAASVLGAGEAWLTELSTAELRRVVALGDEARG
ncbi:DEAD/DEAH box helicase [Longimicrobium terrae]|uniref:Non-specific serine/threonine protein kinase n=1 Tax=Longimicrobium terrae TaxID=1639882 RepID=A0A841GU33_9BACT|nr:DEAD/DEAH box helicase [Longimicrobium terrae]MBB4634626.1 non-specific serine/threonine protein kinase [Longimicrobium terrae]MBB6068484.1 non-specific serine/threonine protein kinase [Longimicrobium terrae]NNC27674.1 DEAD/DEAH box helicase [Longimicrobium terrae]